MPNRNNNNQTTMADVQNPLYLHPSDGINSVSVDEKLVGIANYRSWRRCIEIQLSAKRKLGFVNGKIDRPTDDDLKADLWDTANSMVISWILSNVSEAIKSSVLFIGTAHEIWTQLESRFAINSGARKYQLSKDVHNMSQNGQSVSDYYTRIKALWEEMDGMDELPKLTITNSEIRAFLRALNKQKDEQKLFQFLNGLDNVPAFDAVRSQIIMMSPLPSVEVACSLLQQEETQRRVLEVTKPSHESSAMFGKAELKCTGCGNKGHTKDRCWKEIGYPSWHALHKTFPQKSAKGKENFKKYNQNQVTAHQNKWNKGKSSGSNSSRVNANAANASTGGGDSVENLQLTPQQLQQLLKLLPRADQNDKCGSDTEEELEPNFAGLCLKGD